jgi:hypothetical protein
MVTYAECHAWAEIFMIARGRAAQNSQMIFHCVADSITSHFKTELMAESEKYIIDGHTKGLCFLKLLISKAQIDTIATVNILRSSIGRLPSKMVELSGNITAFNSYVKNIETSLVSYGHRADELMTNMFLAYAAVEDEDFVSYIKMKKNQWEEGTSTLTLDGLLSNAENHYKMQNQQESWMAPSRKDEEIMALKALLGNKSGGAKSNDGKKKKTGEERLKEGKEKNPWKNLPPNEGEPKSKHVNNALWHWCTKQNRWTGHTDAECQGVGVFIHRGTNNNSQRRNNGNNVSFKADVDKEEEEDDKPTLQVKQSLISIMLSGSELFE